MSTRDVAAALRKVSELRALCLRLPHLPTPLETERLERFEALAAAPELATENDVEALAAGWREWWRTGRAEELLAMAARVPSGLRESDRRLATYAVAAAARTKGTADLADSCPSGESSPPAARDRITP